MQHASAHVHEGACDVLCNTQDDIILGRKLATGGFGTVFLGDLRKEDGTLVPVVVKKVRVGRVLCCEEG